MSSSTSLNLFSRFEFKRQPKTEKLIDSSENVQQSSEEKHVLEKYNHNEGDNCIRHSPATEDMQDNFVDESLFEDETSFDMSFQIDERNENCGTKNCINFKTTSTTVANHTDKYNFDTEIFFDEDFEFNDEDFDAMLVKDCTFENTPDRTILSCRDEPQMEKYKAVNTIQINFLEESGVSEKACSSKEGKPSLFGHQNESITNLKDSDQNVIPYFSNSNEYQEKGKSFDGLQHANQIAPLSSMSKAAPTTLSLQKRFNCSLQPYATMCYESPERTVRKRKFPGPAGLLPDGPSEKSKMPIMELQSPSHQSLPGYRYSQELLCSQTSDEDFQMLSWQEMLKRAGRNANLQLYNIRNVLQSAKLKCLPKHVVTKVLCVMLKKINRGGMYEEAIFKDETGEVAGKIDPEVLNRHADYLRPGVVMVLKNVTFLFNQLILKEDNLAVVYGCDGKENVISNFLHSKSYNVKENLAVEPASENDINKEKDECFDENLLEDGLDDFLQDIDNFGEG